MSWGGVMNQLGVMVGTPMCIILEALATSRCLCLIKRDVVGHQVHPCISRDK